MVHYTQLSIRITSELIWYEKFVLKPLISEKVKKNLENHWREMTYVINTSEKKNFE